MRVERRLARPLAAMLLAATPAPRPVTAQPVTGYAQVQFQERDQKNRAEAPGNRWLSQRFWLKTFDLNSQGNWGQSLMFQANYRFSDLSYVNQPDATRPQQWSARLAHPWANVYASYRPTRTTSGLGTQGQSGADGADAAATITARTQETMLVGQVTPPKLPQVSVTWVRRHRNADPTSPEETGTTRNARVSYTVGPLALYGSVADQQRESGLGGSPVTTQRSGATGGTLHLAPSTTSTLDLNYDYAQTRSGETGRALGSSRSHNLGLQGAWSQTPKLGWNLSYSFHRTDAPARLDGVENSHEGVMLLSYALARRVRLSTGGGLRTVREQERDGLLRYLTAVLSADGQVKPGWTAVAGLSHVNNWDPVRGDYAVEGLQVGSRLRLSRGLDLNLDGRVTANGDTAARDQRWVGDATARMVASPLRTLGVGLFVRGYRSGPGLGSAYSRTQSTGTDLRWKPVTTLEMLGTYSVSGALPDNRPRVSTRTATVRWVPSSRLQVSGDWSRSDQQRTDVTANLLSGREFAGLRTVAALTKRLTLNSGATVAERHTPRESWQYDAALTLSFGR